MAEPLSTLPCHAAANVGDSDTGSDSDDCGRSGDNQFGVDFQGDDEVGQFTPSVEDEALHLAANQVSALSETECQMWVIERVSVSLCVTRVIMYDIPFFW